MKKLKIDYLFILVVVAAVIFALLIQSLISSHYSRSDTQPDYAAIATQVAECEATELFTRQECIDLIGGR